MWTDSAQTLPDAPEGFAKALLCAAYPKRDKAEAEGWPSPHATLPSSRGHPQKARPPRYWGGHSQGTAGPSENVAVKKAGPFVWFKAAGPARLQAP